VAAPASVGLGHDGEGKLPQSDFRREDAEYCDYHQCEGKALCLGCN
jgi:hypothetical protein